MNYIPDNWKIIRIQYKDADTNHFLAAGFVGGYTQGRSWKISSGITGVANKTSEYVEFINKSGSIYRCYYSNEGLDYYTESVIESYRLEHEKAGDTFELIDYEYFG
jgi:hypothetical protein